MSATTLKIEPYFYPILATNNAESASSLLNKWDRFDMLSEANQNKISSQETAKKIQQISLKFELNPRQISAVSIATRVYYFGELTLDDMSFYLAKEIPIDLSKAKEISQVIIQKIINDNSQEKAYQSQLEKLPIDIAIKKYPEVSEQLITSDYIKLKSFFEPVRPSIKNWLSDYTFNIGISNHDPIVRGNYLFKNENARKLSAGDRDKLSQILKSFEEKTPLAINTSTKQVVFSAMISREKPKISQKKPAVAVMPLSAQNAPRQNFPPAQPTQIKQKTESRSEKQKVIQPAAQPAEKKDAIPKKPQVFQTDKERLSAWRKNLLKESASSANREITESKNDNINRSSINNVRFSSTQKFSTEKPAEISRIVSPNYPNRLPSAKNNYLPARSMPKNVVDLREE